MAVPNGLDATYYDDESLSTPRRTRVDSAINLNIASEADFSTGARTTNDVALSDVQSFAVRWAGLLKPCTAATSAYTFYVVLPQATATVNGERVKLWVDNQLVVDVWDTYTDVSATVYSATANVRGSSTQQLYTEVKLEYKQYAATVGGVRLEWELAGTRQAVPSANLFLMRHIAGSPFPPRIVNAALTCATTSTMRGNALASATAGVQATYLVESHDSFGNERGAGGDMYMVRLWPASVATCPYCPNSVMGTIVDNGDSSYTATYNATKTGSYLVTTSLLTTGGLSASYYGGGGGLNALVGNPTTAANSPSFVGYPTSTSAPLRVRYTGFVRPTTAGVYTFTMDVSNAPTDIANEGLRLYLEGNLIYNDWTSLLSTTETATYNFASANGYYSLILDYNNQGTTPGLTVKWKGPTMAAASTLTTDRMFTRDDVDPTNPRTLVVLPELTDAGASIASGDGLSICTAGFAAGFTITTKDSFANERGLDEDSYLIRLQMDGAALVNVGGVAPVVHAWQVRLSRTLAQLLAPTIWLLLFLPLEV